MGKNNVILNIIIKVWYFPFVGFFESQDYITVREILLSGSVIPIVATIGYVAGVRNFSVLEKFAYRKNRKKIEEKKSENK